MTDTLPPNYSSIDGTPVGPIKADYDPIAAANEKLNLYLSSGGARDAIALDIRKLSNIITSIEDDFATIAHAVSRLDRKQLAPEPFAPTWKKHHNTYRELMKISQRTANGLSDKLIAFVTVLIPKIRDNTVDMSKKQGMLSEYIETLGTFISDAEVTSDKFKDLRQDVEGFRKDLYLDLKDKEDEVFKQFKDVDAEIKRLESTLAKLSRKLSSGLKSAKTALSSLFPKTKSKDEEVAGTDSLTTIAPTVGMEMTEIVLEYLSSGLADDLKKARTDMDAEAQELFLAKLKLVQDQKEKIREEFRKAFDDISKLESVFDGMTERIVSIQQIWRMLLQDSQSLSSKLLSMKNTKYEETFDGYLLQLECTYVALRYTLQQYANAVNPEK